MNECLFCREKIPHGETIRIVTRYACGECFASRDVDSELRENQKLRTALEETEKGFVVFLQRLSRAESDPHEAAADLYSLLLKVQAALKS